MGENGKLYQHLLLTRFNIRFHAVTRLKNPDNDPKKRILEENYLEERFQIFETYTLPSVKRQTNGNFTWLIFFHKNTPEKFKKKIQCLKTEFPFVDLYLDDTETFDFMNYCRSSLNSECRYYITSRLDNDDMIADTYIERIQNYADKDLHTCVLSFEVGMKHDLESKVNYECKVQANHFISMISPPERYILMYDHSKIINRGGGKLPIVILHSDQPMWVEIVHKSNITNRIKENDKVLL